MEEGAGEPLSRVPAKSLRIQCQGENERHGTSGKEEATGPTAA